MKNRTRAAGLIMSVPENQAPKLDYAMEFFLTGIQVG